MIRGLYTAGAGMMLQMARQDVLAHNLANVNTTGFKRADTISREFPEMVISRLGEIKNGYRQIPFAIPPIQIGNLGTGATVDSIVTDYAQGPLKYTSDYTDLALTQGGYFVIQTPDGNRYTRDGAFKVTVDQLLTTNEGHPVLDENQNLIYLDGRSDPDTPVDLIDPTLDYVVDSWGRISVNGEYLTRLLVVDFPDPDNVAKLDRNWIASDQQYQVLDNPQLVQGYLEASNVNAVQEMVTLISTVRAYESLQKMVQTEDELIKVAIDQVGSTA